MNFISVFGRHVVILNGAKPSRRAVVNVDGKCDLTWSKQWFNALLTTHRKDDLLLCRGVVVFTRRPENSPAQIGLTVFIAGKFAVYISWLNCRSRRQCKEPTCHACVYVCVRSINHSPPPQYCLSAADENMKTINVDSALPTQICVGSNNLRLKIDAH